MHHTDDARLFESLVDAHYRSLYQFAYSLVHQESEASDLTQETFLVWARKRHTLRDPSKAKTWLFTTLYREFLKSRRHQAVLPHRALEAADESLPNPSAAAVERLDSEAALEALATLQEIYRAPLHLFYVGEHSYKEISDILSVPIGTVQSRISRGKAQLREALARAGRSVDGDGRVNCG